VRICGLPWVSWLSMEEVGLWVVNRGGGGLFL
jgi:hypothetical protein